MASRNFNRKQALEKEVKDLYIDVSIGAAGAPTLSSSVGIASITRNGAGDYTVVLQDKFVSLKFVDVKHLASSAQDLHFQLHSESVSVSKEIRFLCLTAATPTDPANGSRLKIQIQLKNTSVI